jgi:hypothetical protein
MLRASVSRLTICTAAMAVLVAAANYFIPFFDSFQLFTWLSLAFFFVVTVITLYIGMSGLEKSSYGFVASVNGIVLIKLMLSVALVIGYMLVERPHQAHFIIPFFFFYIVYTIFEVQQLLAAQKMKGRQKLKS